MEAWGEGIGGWRRGRLVRWAAGRGGISSEGRRCGRDWGREVREGWGGEEGESGGGEGGGGNGEGGRWGTWTKGRRRVDWGKEGVEMGVILLGRRGSLWILELVSL